jgi:hypothetical protein
MTTQNTLQKFYRSEKIFINLPSGQNWYKNGEVVFNESNEVGIMPMTARDEYSFKNPDMLLNGEAILNVIRSCVPSVKDPNKLLSNDVDALLVAIRHVTYGKSHDTKKECPSCKKENTYSVDLDAVIGTIGKLEDDYTITLDTGIVLHIRPLKLSESNAILKNQFTQTRALSLIEKDPTLTDEQRTQRFQAEFVKVVELNAKMLCASVSAISHTTENFNITDEAEIRSFLNNVDRSVIESIDSTLKQITKIGVSSEFKATCVHCQHEWTCEIDYNPVTFFTKS